MTNIRKYPVTKETFEKIEMLRKNYIKTIGDYKISQAKFIDKLLGGREFVKVTKQKSKYR